MVNEISPEYAKAAWPILVTELGMVIDVSDAVKPKTCYPILVTELGIFLDVIPDVLKAR